MKKTLTILIAFAGLSFGAAKSYTVTLFQNSVIAGQELKAGSYRLELNDQTLTIKNGKNSITTSVKVESEKTKYTSTSVRYTPADGKNKLDEIRLGGTNVKLVLND